MMKTKVLSLLMIVSLLFGQTIVYAAEKTDALPELTIEEAVTKAVAHSSAIKKNQENKASLEIEVKKARSDMLNSTSNSAYTSNYTRLLNAQLSLAQLEPDTKVQREKLEYSLTEYFVKIIAAQKDLALLDKTLQQQKNNLDVSAIKLQLGRISQATYDTEKYNYEVNVADRANSVAAIDQDFRNLNDKMGQSKEKKYALVLALTYEPIGDDFNVNRVIVHAIEDSAAVESAEHAVYLAKYESDAALNYNEDTGVWDDGVSVNKSNALAQAGRTLEDTKDSIEKSILDLYDAVLNLERTYDNTVKQLAKEKADLEIIEIQFQLGQKTALEVDSAKLSIEKLEERIRATIDNHAVKVMPLKNPNLL